jgi:hypothetical protein
MHCDVDVKVHLMPTVGTELDDRGQWSLPTGAERRV